MKYEVLFSLKTMKKYSRLSSAAVVIGTLRVKDPISEVIFGQGKQTEVTIVVTHGNNSLKYKARQQMQLLLSR